MTTGEGALLEMDLLGAPEDQIKIEETLVGEIITEMQEILIIEITVLVGDLVVELVVGATSDATIDQTEGTMTEVLVMQELLGPQVCIVAQIFSKYQ